MYHNALECSLLCPSCSQLPASVMFDEPGRTHLPEESLHDGFRVEADGFAAPVLPQLLGHHLAHAAADVAPVDAVPVVHPNGRPIISCCDLSSGHQREGPRAGKGVSQQ